MDQRHFPDRALKMHGLGNDFILLDCRRSGAPPPVAEVVRQLADRHWGIGCDTLVHIAPREGGARLRFFNADGSAASACGNATRCVGALFFEESTAPALTLHVVAPDGSERALAVERAAGGLIRVNMGAPVFDWQAIPLAEAIDPDHLPIPGDPAALAMPNPHCVFFVPEAEAVDPAEAGPAIEHHALFPDRTNVEFVSPLGPDRLRMRVWERGGMVTQACGSGACAVAVAAHRRGLTGRRVEVVLDGGPLEIDWREDGVWMTGPATHVAALTLNPALLAPIP